MFALFWSLIRLLVLARHGSGHCAGELGPPPTAHGVQAALPETPTAKGRSMVLAVPLQDLEGLAPCFNHRPTRDRGVVASQGLPTLLDLDLRKEAPRSPRGQLRDSSLDHEDGRGQPAVGRAPHRVPASGLAIASQGQLAIPKKK